MGLSLFRKDTVVLYPGTYLAFLESAPVCSTSLPPGSTKNV